MSELPVSIPHGEDLIIGDFHRGGDEAVLLLSGWGGTRYGPQRILLQTAAALAEHGLTTLRLDFRGRGDSTGNAGDATLDRMIEDALTAAAWLREEEGIVRLHLVGICSGGNVALGAASLLTNVDNVVCWSLLPFMEHKAKAAKQGTPRGALLRQYLRKALKWETWLKLFRGEANLRGAAKVMAKDKEGDSEERQRKTSSRDILADLERFTGHLYLLYGSRDPEAAGSQTFFTDWCKRHNIPATTETIPGAPHNFYTVQWTRKVVEQTAAWLAEKQ
ncbi:MAG: alpha/beta hydrolase family protein [Armatimonadota bacterium]